MRDIPMTVNQMKILLL